jgi:hypothetical protein
MCELTGEILEYQQCDFEFLSCNGIWYASIYIIW